MKKTFFKALAFVAVLAVATVGAKEITDSSTGAGFPSEVTFSHGGTDYTPSATAHTARECRATEHPSSPASAAR